MKDLVLIAFYCKLYLLVKNVLTTNKNVRCAISYKLALAKRRDVRSAVCVLPDDGGCSFTPTEL